WLSSGGGWFASSGKAVSIDSALQVSAVWACVRLIAETIATLPLGVYIRKKDGSREIDRSMRLHDLISNMPNSRMTAVNFWESVVASMLFRGAAYVEVKRLGGLAVALDILMPQQITWCKKKELWIYREAGGSREISPADVMHIPAFSL